MLETHNTTPPTPQASPALIMDGDNFQQAVQAANAALTAAGKTVSHLLAVVGPVIEIGRQEAEKKSGKKSGPTYSKRLNEWAVRVGFSLERIGKYDRSAIFNLRTNPDDFTRWWSGVTPSEQTSLTSVRVTWGKFRRWLISEGLIVATTATIEPQLIDPKLIEEMTPAELAKLPKAKLLEHVERITEDRDRYKTDLEELSDTRTPDASTIDWYGEPLEIERALRSQPASLDDPHRVIKALKISLRNWERDLALCEDRPKPSRKSGKVAEPDDLA